MVHLLTSFTYNYPCLLVKVGRAFESKNPKDIIYQRNHTSVRDNKLCLKALSCIYIRDIVAWQPSIYHGWLLRQNPHVKYAMLEKTQLFRIFDNVSSKCLGLVVKETVCP